MGKLKQRAFHQRMAYIIHIAIFLGVILARLDNLGIQFALFLGLFIVTFGGIAYVYEIPDAKEFMNHSRRISISEWYHFGSKWINAIFLFVFISYIGVCSLNFKFEKYQEAMMLFITLDTFMISMLGAIINKDIYKQRIQKS